MNNFTIVTPTYNNERYLPETIESVLKNLSPGDEYYVIDGGSSDHSPEIIRSYEKYLTGWVSEPDRGYADAVAKGFSRGRNPLQAWINSGDLFLEGAISCARELLAGDQADFIFGDDYYVDEDGAVLFRSHGGVRALRDMMLYGGWTPLQDACFWRRSLYERVGGINPGLRLAADYDLFLRFASHGTWRYVPVAFSAFRRHEGQQSIGHASAYHSEKGEVIRRQKATNGQHHGPVMQACYYIWARIRPRIFQRYWNSTREKGKPISLIHTECLGRKA